MITILFLPVIGMGILSWVYPKSTSVGVNEPVYIYDFSVKSYDNKI